MSQIIAAAGINAHAAFAMLAAYIEAAGVFISHGEVALGKGHRRWRRRRTAHHSSAFAILEESSLASSFSFAPQAAPLPAEAGEIKLDYMRK